MDQTTQNKLLAEMGLASIAPLYKMSDDSSKVFDIADSNFRIFASNLGGSYLASLGAKVTEIS
jgi:predicted deacetylase